MAEQLAALAILETAVALTIDVLTLPCGQRWAMLCLDGQMYATWEIGT